MVHLVTKVPRGLPLSYQVLLLALRIDICISVYIERRRCRVTLWFYGFGEKLLGHDNPTFCTFCFSFRMEVKCSLNVFNLLYRGNDLS